MQRNYPRIILLSLGILSGCDNWHRHGTPYLKSAEPDETSGVVASTRHKNVLYIHNDSGDVSRFFAVNTNGDLLSTNFYVTDLNGGLSGAVDCEDIAMGPGPDPRKNYIYIGDIGDNRAVRPYITVYRLEEPLKLSAFMHSESKAIRLKYPDGPRDAEALLVDPLNKLLFIVSKREDSVGVYSTPLLPAEDSGTLLLKKTGEIYIKGDNELKNITGGSVSHDGKQVLLRTYAKVFRWKRNGKEPLEKTLSGTPEEIDCRGEPQGEAICFSADDKGVYCISEGRRAMINYKLLPVPAAIP